MIDLIEVPPSSIAIEWRSVTPEPAVVERGSYVKAPGGPGSWLAIEAPARWIANEGSEHGAAYVG